MSNSAYDSFYKSVKDFLLEANLLTTDGIQNASKKEILDIEEHIGQILPVSFKTFLEYFGKKISIYPEFAMTLYDITKAYSKAPKIKDFLIQNNYILNSDGVKIANGEVVFIDFIDGKYVEEEIVNIKDLINCEKMIFLNTDSTTTFINAEEENPIIHFLLTDYSFTSSRLRLTDYIRSAIFSRIKNKLEYRDSLVYDEKKNFIMYQFSQKIKKINLDDRKWANSYYKFYQSKTIPPYKINEYRDEFYTINRKEEENKKYILTIDEFEWAFITYLNEKGFDS